MNNGPSQAFAASSLASFTGVAALTFEADTLRMLMESPEPDAHRLLRRLTASSVTVMNEWVAILGPEADAIRRDIILRQFHDPGSIICDF